MNSAHSPKSEFLLLFRGTDWHRALSPQEIKDLMVQWMAWSDGLVAEGRSKARRSLSGTGKIVSGAERMVSDGPYSEAKETVAGYFLLEVDGMDEAVKIARECPAVPFGMTVEVRPMPAQCLASELATASVDQIVARLTGRGTPAPEPAAAQA